MPRINHVKATKPNRHFLLGLTQLADITTHQTSRGRRGDKPKYLSPKSKLGLNFMDELIEWGEQTADYLPFTVKGVPFILVHQNFHDYVTDKNQIVILKHRAFLENEIAMFKFANPKTIMEFGLFEGGSAVLWHLLFGCKFLGVDLREEPKAIKYWINKLDIGKDVKLVYGVSQDDEIRIYKEIEKFFGTAKLDLVIDDASHLYTYSRRTFEIMLPRVRVGGMYCLEDWSWAHANNDTFQKELLWRDSPALSNLLFEIQMAFGTNGYLFSQMTIQPFAAYMFVNYDFSAAPIKLDDYILKQGRAYVPF
jgi:cephalosporin hydroxylase